jgi:Uma2 family endonuclease
MAQLAQDRSLNQLRNAQSRSSYPADWYIEDDEPVGQDPDHQEDEFIMQSTLLAWRKRTKQEHLLIGCEMACRWDSAFPKVGVDPDVYVVDRPPPRNKKGKIGSLRTWEGGHHPPLLAIEIVSDSRPGKDYKDSPEKHDLLGTFELWIFDPHLSGYTKEQPPVPLQVFQRETNHCLVQMHAGAGPYRSDALDAWVMVIEDELVIADDREGNDRWPTLEEAEKRRADEEAQRANDANKRANEEAQRANDANKRANEEAQRANDANMLAREEAKRANDANKRATAEQAEKETALKRIAELEALLAKHQ